MNTYISLVNYTESGIKTIKDAPERIEGVRALARKLGGEMNDIYLTMGSYDLVVISQFPDGEAAATFALTVGGMGHVRTTTLQAFDEGTFRNIVSAL